MSVIGIDYTPAFEQGGGIGRYVRELIAALARHDLQNSFHLFVAGATRTQLPSPPGNNFLWTPTRISPRCLARIWHRAHLPLPVETFTGPISLYHATDFVLPPIRPNTRTLLTVHDLSFVRVPEAASPRLKAYLDRVVPRSAHRADHILADSQATKEDLIELYRLSPDKITVLLSGVDQRFVRVTDAATRQGVRNKYGIGAQPYLFSVGTVQPRKNYARLTQALARLRSEGYDLLLIIAGGKGWLEDPIHQAISDAKMSDFVRFIGFADEIDLPALYSEAELLVFPSLYEGFGLPILESMGCGTPVVTSSVSSLPEVGGDAALLVDPYDVDAIAIACRRVFDDRALRDTLIQRGYDRVKQFSWDSAAAHLRRIYTNLLTS